MRVRLVLTFIAAVLPCAAHAERLFLDNQGNSPNRIAYFSDDFATDTTILGGDVSGPTLHKRIEVTMVFEAKDQPYWTTMDLEFKCPNPNHKMYMPKKKKGAETAEWVLPAADTVEFRMVSGQTRLKTKVERKTLTPTDWQSTGSYAMKRVYRVACNADAISRAKNSSPAADGKTVDMAVLRGKMEGLGLQSAAYIPSGTFGDSLGEFTWATLWKDARMPAIDNGRPLTAEEKKALDAKMAQLKIQMDADRAKVQGDLEQMKAGFEFTAAAAKFRGNRKWSQTERVMNSVWQGKTEADVVAAVGPPAVADAGGVRFLSYGQEFDRRYVMQNMMTGYMWTEGMYSSCNIRFALIPDHKNVLRVADVVVTAQTTIADSTVKSRGSSERALCSELLEVPR